MDLNADNEWGACTDIGNALRLAARFEETLRYVPSHGWLRYEGHRMVKLDGLPIDEGTALPELIRSEVGRGEDEDRRKELYKWAEKSGSGSRIREALAIAADLPAIRASHETLDKDPLMLNTPVGAYDLVNGERWPTVAEDLMTRSTRLGPKPGAPVFERFLEQVLPSYDVRKFLQRAVGYSITGLTREEVFFLLYGQGQNGKSKLLSAVAHALGNYSHSFDPKLIVQQKYEGHPTNIASLHGVRFAYSSEVGEGAALDEGRVKAITGGDTMTARFMRKDEFSWVPTHKLWMATNHLPVIKGTDKGMWRRVLVIPFDVNIPTSGGTTCWRASCTLRRRGILAWCIDGAIAYLKDGLRPPVEVIGKRALQAGAGPRVPLPG
jgi:putative DNA primase/helicase